MHVRKIAFSALFISAGIVAGVTLDRYIPVSYGSTVEDSITATQPTLESGNEFLSDSIQLIIPTFLGNSFRAFYGDSLPDTLEMIWKIPLGKGITYVQGDSAEEWMGAGWTGQPLLLEYNSEPFLIQGAFDHHLRCIKAQTGEVVWKYKFDDIIKGTGTIWIDPAPSEPENRVLIMQGSRLGNGNWLSSDTVTSYRCISFFTGNEVWRMQVERGPSFSRDVDGSGIVVNNFGYIGLENGFLRKFNPAPSAAVRSDSLMYAVSIADHPMFRKKDQATHGGELVVESSPALLNNHLYYTCGSGHVFGYNLLTDSIDWDLHLGCDMDGSAVVTSDSCLLITLEKQFIKGRGGVMKINPHKNPERCVEWYLPVKNKEFATWHGGIIGSAAVNDYTMVGSSGEKLAATVALDGNLYVIKHKTIKGTDTAHDHITVYPKPEVVYNLETGPSISTPIFAGNRLLVATYTNIWLLEYNSKLEFNVLAKLPGGFESTPVCYKGRVFIASRNGFMYCFGRKELKINE